MSFILQIHAEHPQPRLLKQVVELIEQGGVAALPTDAGYILACRFDHKQATENIRRIRQMNDKHLLTLMVKDFSQLAQFAQINNQQYRLMKAVMPGPYVMVLKASKEAPRRMLHASRKTIGFRMPEHTLLQALLEQIGVPLSTATLKLSPDEAPLTDAEDILQKAGKRLAVIVDVGVICHSLTTVIDLSNSDHPKLLRLGCGEIDNLEIDNS